VSLDETFGRAEGRPALWGKWVKALKPVSW
jgi:hypothetical protein